MSRSLLFRIYSIIINITTFLLFGRDKYRATTHGWRISENTLLLLTALGGWIGAVIAQSVFHHKTTKTSFVWKFRVIVVGWIVLIGRTFLT